MSFSLRVFFVVLLVILHNAVAYRVAYSKYAFYDVAFHSTDKYDIYSKHFDEAGLAPKTKWVQRFIHMHQNPSDCSKVKFMTTEGFNHGGLGAEMIGVASHLSYAIAHNYILIWDKSVESKYFNASSECYNKGYSCIFQPLSKCEEGNISESEQINEIFNIFLIPPNIEQAVYKQFPNLSHAQALYWWRAQSVGYI